MYYQFALQQIYTFLAMKMKPNDLTKKALHPKCQRLSDKTKSTSKITENIIRCLVSLLQVCDLLFILARTAASSLEMYCNLFSKSSLFNLKIPFQIREMIPLRFFPTTAEEAAESLFSLSVPLLSSAISSFAPLPCGKNKDKLSNHNNWLQWIWKAIRKFHHKNMKLTATSNLTTTTIYSVASHSISEKIFPTS